MAKRAETDHEKLKARAQARLAELGRSQKQVDEACGWSAGTTSRLLGGRKGMTPEALAALAEALELPIATLAADTAWATVAPAPASTPKPAPEPAPSPEPAPERPVDTAGDDAAPSGEPRRRRKRDLPLNVLRFIAGKLLGG